MAAARAGDAASAGSISPPDLLPGGRAGARADRGSSRPLPDRLDSLAAIAARLGARRLEADARALAERARTDRFYVAVVGQFKRGKSTLINALIGDAVLPTGILPVTAVPVVLRHGPQRIGLIRTSSGTREVALEQLGDFISEERNRENRLGVESVEVLLPSPMLAHGLCLVDTPGLGSAFPRTTEAVRAFVPHIDAAIVVVGSDPPLTGDELAAVEAVARHSMHLVAVLNKADRATPEELVAARTFAERMLAERLGREVGPVLEVSASEALAGGATRDWGRLVEALGELGARAGRTLAAAGVERGAGLLFDRCLRELDRARDLAMWPVTALEERLESLANAAADVALDWLPLRGDLERRAQEAVQTLAHRRAELLSQAIADGRTRLRAELPASGMLGSAAARRRAIALARALAGEALAVRLGAERPDLEEIVRSACDDFERAAQAAVERVGELGGAVTIALPAIDWPLGEEALADDRDDAEAIGGLLRDLAPWRWTRRSIARSADAELERCLVAGATRAHRTLADLVHRLEAEAHQQAESAIEDFNESVDRVRARTRQARHEDEATERQRLQEIVLIRHEVFALRDGRWPRGPEPGGGK